MVNSKLVTLKDKNIVELVSGISLLKSFVVHAVIIFSEAKKDITKNDISTPFFSKNTSTTLQKYSDSLLSI